MESTAGAPKYGTGRPHTRQIARSAAAARAFPWCAVVDVFGGEWVGGLAVDWGLLGAFQTTCRPLHML